MPAKAVTDPEAYQLELGQHLLELKRRITQIILVFVPVTVIGLVNAKPLVSMLLRNSPPIYFFAPGEAFSAHLRVAVLLGLTAAWPLILLQAYRFAAPGLYPNERRALLWILPAGLLLFAAGGLFGYVVAVPVLQLWLGRWASDTVQATVSVALYVAFLTRIVLASALAWQLPLVSVVLTSLGLVSARAMAAHRRWVLLGIVAGSALLTPPDPVSQLMVAGPAVILYEISVQLARLVERTAGRRAGAGSP